MVPAARICADETEDVPIFLSKPRFVRTPDASRSQPSRVVLAAVLLAVAAAVSCTPAPADPDPSPSSAAAPSPVGVSENGRYLVRADGQPFVFLGDTAWSMLANLDHDVMTEYLTTRRDQGFTVIQAAIYFDQAGMPRGTPFDGDVSKPNEAFFAEQVDFAVAKAAELGLTLALHPVWADGATDKLITVDNAEGYGRFLGERYSDANIIWVLGGDESADGREQLWRNLARGLAVGQTGSEDYSKSLRTYHPVGDQSSSTWFHDDDWLDFNSVQSGHCPRSPLPYDLVSRDYQQTPVKPVIDFEPMYENHPYCWAEPPDGFSTTLDVRKMAYWNYLAGGFGHSYGHHSLWGFVTGAHPFDSVGGGAPGTWRQAMDAEGGRAMTHLRTLMESRPLELRVPDQAVIAGDAGTGMDRKQAARAADGSYLMVYTVGSVRVDLTSLSGTAIQAYWYDPRTGEATEVAVEKGASVQVSPPGGEDWVFVADDAARGYPPPGASTGR